MTRPEPPRPPFAAPGALVLAAMVALGLIAVVVALAATLRLYGEGVLS